MQFGPTFLRWAFAFCNFVAKISQKNLTKYLDSNFKVTKFVVQ